VHGVLYCSLIMKDMLPLAVNVLTMNHCYMILHPDKLPANSVSCTYMVLPRKRLLSQPHTAIR